MNLAYPQNRFTKARWLGCTFHASTLGEQLNFSGAERAVPALLTQRSRVAQQASLLKYSRELYESAEAISDIQAPPSITVA